MDSEALKQLERDYTGYLQAQQDEVLRRVSQIAGKQVKLASWHAQIGGKNRIFTDVVREQFPDPRSFVVRWLKGLEVAAKEEYAEESARYGRPLGTHQAGRLVVLLQDPVIWDYVQRFHERNFYRKLDERIRPKPHDTLWALWFGRNPLVWGLLLTPEFRRGEWRTDASEIRKARYSYWTVGHVLDVGFVVPSDPMPQRFNDVSTLMQFYRTILKRLSASKYEHGIIDRYEQYLVGSTDVSNEPFLVPELRYAGLAVNHEYRLDFAILNPHVMAFTGFELSPASTHLAIQKLKERTQADVNLELAGKWDKEIQKRQRYFDTYGIRIETFTDSDLGDLDGCFARMRMYLAARNTDQKDVAEQLAAVRALQLA